MGQEFLTGIDNLGISRFEEQKQRCRHKDMVFTSIQETPDEIHRRLGQWGLVTDFQIGDTFTGKCGVEVITELEPSIVMVSKEGNERQCKRWYIQQLISMGLLERTGHVEIERG